MDLSTITIQDFKDYFTRDFPYLPDPYTGCAADQLDFVLDSDITKAFGQTQIKFNQSLFSSDANITIGYFWLTAHYMVIDLQAAQQGIASSGAKFNVSSRSVGSVSESYDIPDIYKKNAFIAFLSKTAYGEKYFSLIISKLVGNTFTVCGGTQP